MTTDHAAIEVEDCLPLKDEMQAPAVVLDVPGLDMVKRCPSCGETKSIDEFYRASRPKDGHCVYCKTCSNARHDAWRLANRERLAAYQRAYDARRKAAKEKA